MPLSQAFLLSILCLGATWAYRLPFAKNLRMQPLSVQSPAMKLSKLLLGSVLALGANQFTILLPAAHAVEVIQSQEVAQSQFVGGYSDPKHPDCLRSIVVRDSRITVVGSDNTDGSKKWVLKATEVDSGKLLVDFSPKGGPKDLLGVYSAADNGIKVSISSLILI